MKTIKDTPRAEDKPTSRVVFNQIQNRIVDHEDEAVKYCQENYPETCNEFLNKWLTNTFYFVRNKRIMDQVIYQ